MHTPFTRSIYTSLFGLLLLFTPAGLFGEGFRAGTLVATPTGLCPIETLLPGDRVISRTKTGEETESLITAVSKKLTMDVRKLVVAGESALVDKNQRFYVTNKRAWCAVETLSPGDELVSSDGHKICVENIHECDKELTTLYRLSVAHHHNFGITQSKLVAHNLIGAEFTTVKTATDAAIAIVSGTGVVVSLPVACVVGGAGVICYGIYSLVERQRTKNKPQSSPPDQNTNNNRSDQASQQHEQVRGFGTFTDKELEDAYRKSCIEQEQNRESLRAAPCLPETNPAIVTRGTCTIQQNPIEKEIVHGPIDTSAALDPEKIPRCGLQGQTLPSLDAPVEAKESGDTATTGEKTIAPHASSETSPAQAESKDEISLDSACAGLSDANDISVEGNAVSIELGHGQKSAADEPISTTEQSLKTVEELIQDLLQEDRKKGPSRQYQKLGGFDQALEDFESLNPQDIKDIVSAHKGQHGVLPDGRSINVRSGCSGDSRPTLEVQSSNSNKRIKIRYTE